MYRRCVCVYASIFTCTHTDTVDTQTQMYMHPRDTHTHTYACTHAHTYTHACTHMHRHYHVVHYNIIIIYNTDEWSNKNSTSLSIGCGTISLIHMQKQYNSMKTPYIM